MGHLVDELYKKTIEIDGRIYRYDPDSDCYYRSHHQTSETEQERWTKVAIAISLLIVLYFVTPYILSATQ
jgi:hypothetical protein